MELNLRKQNTTKQEIYLMLKILKELLLRKFMSDKHHTILSIIMILLKQDLLAKDQLILCNQYIK